MGVMIYFVEPERIMKGVFKEKKEFLQETRE